MDTETSHLRLEKMYLKSMYVFFAHSCMNYGSIETLQDTNLGMRSYANTFFDTIMSL